MPFTREQARDRIQELVDRYNAIPRERRKEITESGVVHQYLDPLFEALNWPIHDSERYKYEQTTLAGRPDMMLIPEGGGTIFVEAKRFGAIQDLQQARRTMAGVLTPDQMTLPGMAVDRTAEEQQAINYAFQNGGRWAILTNFEKLRLFNARRDWLVFSVERPGAYLDEFDWLWRLSYACVVSGELDALSDQRHREDVDTDYLAFINEWRERLALDILRRREENAWAIDPDGRVRLAELRAVVQRVLDRLVVVRFAEDHLIVPAGTLFSLYELRAKNPYTFSLSEFFQKLYRRFDEAHNSALFAPGLADQACFGDDVLGGLIRKLYEARYRAMSADIMGNTYEQYLGKTLARSNGYVVTVDNLETRKKQGSYYTPQVIVRYLVDNSLGRYLYGTADGKPDGAPLEGETRKTAKDVEGLRCLDPACGSGSFLIYAYQVLADFYRREIERLKAEQDRRHAELARAGVTAPIDIRIELTPYRAEIERLAGYPRIILEKHLYGVDLDPQAAEIATVNLIMRAMADQRATQQRLPLILNQNIKVGNSLIGAGPDDPRYAGHAADLAGLRRLRLQMVREANGAGHEETYQAIEEIDARVNAALNAGLAGYFGDAETHRPFNWAVEFPEAFVDEQGQHLGETAGFEAIIGNPPWEIVKPDLREFYAQFDPDIESKLTRQQVERRIAELNAEDPIREVGWEAQKAKIEQEATYFRNSPSYTRKGQGDTATHKLFLERGFRLLKYKGWLGFVVPSGIYTDLGTKELREMLMDEGQIEYLFSFSNERFFFPYIDHRFKFTLLGVRKGTESDGFWATFRFNPRVAIAPAELPAYLADSGNLIYVRRKSLERFSPDSLSVMEFQTKQDYDITDIIYDNWPLLGQQVEDKWNVRFTSEFHMTSARHLFSETGMGVALYEGKMIHQFDAYFREPRFWISENDLRVQNYKLGVRAIASSTNERTLIAAILPRKVGAGNSILTVSDELSLTESLFLATVLNSFVLDMVIRLKVTSNINMFFLYQLPVPRLTSGAPFCDAIVPRAARLTCTTADFADLWQEVMGEPWDRTKGATHPDRRQALRDELDALAAHLYGLSHADFEHILGAFPLVFPDSKAGRERKETLLGVYDRFGDITRNWSRQ